MPLTFECRCCRGKKHQVQARGRGVLYSRRSRQTIQLHFLLHCLGPLASSASSSRLAPLGSSAAGLCSRETLTSCGVYVQFAATQLLGLRQNISLPVTGFEHFIPHPKNERNLMMEERSLSTSSSFYLQPSSHFIFAHPFVCQSVYNQMYVTVIPVCVRVCVCDVIHRTRYCF